MVIVGSLPGASLLGVFSVFSAGRGTGHDLSYFFYKQSVEHYGSWWNVKLFRSLSTVMLGFEEV